MEVRPERTITAQTRKTTVQPESLCFRAFHCYTEMRSRTFLMPIP